MRTITRALMFIGCALLAGAEKPSRITIDFETMDRMPTGFSTARTGSGREGRWLVQDDATAPGGKKVLAQTDADKTDSRFPICIYDDLSAADVSVSVRFKAVAGEVDRAAGLVARYKDRDNYYVVRANALEDNVRFYKLEGGKRKQIAGVEAKVTSDAWHSLKLTAKATHFQVHYDDKLLFECDDATFKEAGKAGVWTKADSITRFDDLTIEGQDKN